MHWKEFFKLNIVLVAVFSFSLLFFTSCSSPQTTDTADEVTIILDKMQYSPGEQVNARFGHNGTLYVWGGNHWYVQKLDRNNMWTTIFTGGIKTWLDCREFDSNSKEYPGCEFVLAERPEWYGISKSHSYWAFVWNQHYEKEIKSFECSTEGLSGTRTNNCIVYVPVEEGKYRIGVEYALDINETRNREGVDIMHAEKEFVIISGMI